MVVLPSIKSPTNEHNMSRTVTFRPSLAIPEVHVREYTYIYTQTERNTHTSAHTPIHLNNHTRAQTQEGGIGGLSITLPGSSPKNNNSTNVALRTPTGGAIATSPASSLQLRQGVSTGGELSYVCVFRCLYI